VGRDERNRGRRSSTAGYAVSGAWPRSVFEPGTNVLVRYGGAADPTALATRLASDDQGADEAVVVVSTRSTVESVVDHFERQGGVPSVLGVVGQPPSSQDAAAAVTSARTVALSEGFRALGEATQDLVAGLSAMTDDGRVRLVFDSVTSLATRTDASNVYRFLRILADQLAERDVFATFTLATDVDETTTSVLRSAFDAQFLADTDGDWYRLSPDGGR
jgi:KaiC/GvpD/RAD55 family RecA-like ATPase